MTHSSCSNSIMIVIYGYPLIVHAACLLICNRLKQPKCLPFQSLNLLLRVLFILRIIHISLNQTTTLYTLCQSRILFVNNGMKRSVGSSIPGYINLLNSFLAENCSLSIDKSVNRLGELLRRKCPTITKKIKRSKGNAVNALHKKTVTLNIVKEDLLTGDVAQERLGVVEHDLASAHENISDLESATSI